MYKEFEAHTHIWATATVDVRALPTNAWKSTSTREARTNGVWIQALHTTPTSAHDHHFAVALKILKKRKRKRKKKTALQGKKTESYICFSLCVSAAKQQTKPSTIRRFAFLSQHLPIIFHLDLFLVSTTSAHCFFSSSLSLKPIQFFFICVVLISNYQITSTNC